MPCGRVREDGETGGVVESKAKRCSVRVRVRECGAVPGLYQSGRYRMLLTSQKTKDGRAWGGEEGE